MLNIHKNDNTIKTADRGVVVKGGLLERRQVTYICWIS